VGAGAHRRDDGEREQRVARRRGAAARGGDRDRAARVLVEARLEGRVEERRDREEQRRAERVDDADERPPSSVGASFSESIMRW
jgi:hypothetical protein